MTIRQQQLLRAVSNWVEHATKYSLDITSFNSFFDEWYDSVEYMYPDVTKDDIDEAIKLCYDLIKENF